MKNRWLVLLGLITFVALGASQMLAHHAFYSTYDRDKTMKIEGTLKEAVRSGPAIRSSLRATPGALRVKIIECKCRKWSGPPTVSSGKASFDSW